MVALRFLNRMTINSSAGRTYAAALMGSTVALWREVETPQERRDWPNGLVIRCVFLPSAAREKVGCTCPAATFGRGGAEACPHTQPSLLALAKGDFSKGSRGTLAGPPEHKVPGRLAGNSVPNLGPLVVQESEDNPGTTLDQSLYDVLRDETAFDFSGVEGGGL